MTEMEKTVAELEYQWRRMLWRLFFPFSIGMPILFYLIVIVVPQKSLAKFMFYELVFGATFIGGICAFVNMLMMRNIKLYKDRITQGFRFSKAERVIPLEDAKYSARTSSYHNVMVISNMNRRWGRIIFDSRLISTSNKQKFYEKLSELSGQSVNELKNRYPATKLMKKECANADK